MGIFIKRFISLSFFGLSKKPSEHIVQNSAVFKVLQLHLRVKANDGLKGLSISLQTRKSEEIRKVLLSNYIITYMNQCLLSWRQLWWNVNGKAFSTSESQRFGTLSIAKLQWHNSHSNEIAGEKIS